ncbi:MAG: monovalent cation:H+ antiporter-2, family [Rhodospirillaceae bacterium]|jgi:CPA2 family monovalent cation:H+ antiporter-2|nr:monovalent cation:H+ antiporter-2, family [Rhodospirillaceae bacterium]
MTDVLLIESLVVVLASACAVALAARAGLPATLGYLLAGLVIGPHGLGLLSAGEETRFLAQLGVVFLMFMVGLEFSIPAMIAARADVLGAGGLQVGLTLLLVAGGARLAGVGGPAAILLGGAVAMSSTAIAVKQLADQGEINSQHGRLALGVLVFQDLATLPFLVMIGALGRGGGSSAFDVVHRVALAVFALGGAALLSRPAFRAALSWVAGRRSPDLFLLVVLLLALGTAFLAEFAGLPLPLGAFLAGLVIGESDYRHQVAEDIRPFRDVLLGVFFVTIGMEVNPSAAALSPLSVLAWIIAFLPGKALITMLVAKIMRWPAHAGLRVAVILAHGGEFGLLLLTQGMAAGLIDSRLGQPALLALVITLGIAPVLIQRNAWISNAVGAAFRRITTAEGESAVQDESQGLSDHVIICGCGRVGRLVAMTLDAAKVLYVAIEFDLTRFREAKQRGHRVIFGDASRARILDAAGVARARLLVATFDRRPAIERLLHHARERDPTLPSIVSVADDRDMSALAMAGATVVFPENWAAGLALANQALLLSNFTQEDAARVITAVRAELNPEIRDQVGV